MMAGAAVFFAGVSGGSGGMSAGYVLLALRRAEADKSEAVVIPTQVLRLLMEEHRVLLDFHERVQRAAATIHGDTPGPDLPAGGATGGASPPA